MMFWGSSAKSTANPFVLLVTEQNVQPAILCISFKNIYDGVPLKA